MLYNFFLTVAIVEGKMIRCKRLEIGEEARRFITVLARVLTGARASWVLWVVDLIVFFLNGDVGGPEAGDVSDKGIDLFRCVGGGSV